MTRLRTWIVDLLTWILGCLLPRTKASSHDPYSPLLPAPRVHFPREDGTFAPDEDGIRWASVSRHGLLQAGLVCPFCERVVARTGEFHLVHKTSFGEAVQCTPCRAVLLASPDDDVDPVSPAERYDEEIYHRFATATPRQIKQRITSAPPAVGDWVVIITDRPLTPSLINLKGSEGRVSVITDAVAQVALSGNEGIAGGGLGPGGSIGGNWVDVGLDDIAVMVTPALRPGDVVEVRRGPHVGASGKLVEVQGGMARISTAEGQIIENIVIERIEKVVSNERFI